MEDGWIDISTAPPEFLLNDKGQANKNQNGLELLIVVKLIMRAYFIQVTQLFLPVIYLLLNLIHREHTVFLAVEVEVLAEWVDFFCSER